jgi:hypothetical protein
MKQFKKKKDVIKINDNNDNDNENENKWYSLNDLTIYGAGMLLAAVGLYVSNVNAKKRDFQKSKNMRVNQLSSIAIRKDITPEPLSRDTLQDISRLIERDETMARYLPEYKKTVRKLLAPGKTLSEEDKKVEKILQRLKDNEDDDQLPMHIYRKIMAQKESGVHQETMEEMVLAYAHYAQAKINFHLGKEYDKKYFDPSKEVVDNWHREEAKRRYTAIMRRNGYEIPDSHQTK